MRGTSTAPAGASRRTGRPGNDPAPGRDAWDPARPWRKWYGTARWQRRRRALLDASPLCVSCTRRGLVVPATVADHVEPHRGDPDTFWNGRLQALCKPCHDGDKQREEHGRPRIAVDADGWPIAG
ncbi:HNH endonuclease [Methylobacterium oryzihabitans]|uniref:HNH endonuclease n=1 Tax=Methylobacterium oryzihabitans TaxID=2499852 RepID=A0A437P5D5_9HYPH|nr:HNH endonuclease signature motif containing protein [Methylobacterium oryzihabitans]RVU17485.1 HNH endonuclease [Methylobacterium oryzihabitans]